MTLYSWVTCPGCGEQVQVEYIPEQDRWLYDQPSGSRRPSIWDKHPQCEQRSLNKIAREDYAHAKKLGETATMALLREAHPEAFEGENG